MGSLQPDSMMTRDFEITSVQFVPGHVILAVQNVVRWNVELTEVNTREYWFDQHPDSTGDLHAIPLRETIPSGEQTSVTVNFRWAASKSYYIAIEGVRVNDNWGTNAQILAVAPPPLPLENPFNHPFWHKPLTRYEYW